MSPKSSGRPARRGRAKRPNPPVRELRLSDQVLHSALQIERSDNLLDVEHWASECLGAAWLDAPTGEPEAEDTLCMEVVTRAAGTPSAHGLAAVAALRRLVPDEHGILAAAERALSVTQPRPPFLDSPAWTPVAAWRAVDVWESARMLFVEYDGSEPHALMATVSEPGGRMVTTMALLKPGFAAVWKDDPAMPLTAAPVDEVLTDLAGSLRVTDMTLPKPDDDDFVELRALAWSRCRGHVPDWPESELLPDVEHRHLINDFVASSGLADDEVTRSLADLFIDYGDGYIGAGPLGWSPGWVALFLGDWLPRKVALDADQRAALGEALRCWVRFALARRGLDAQWIEPVVEAVDEHLPEFDEAFDDESSWGSASQVAAELAARGVDLTDKTAVAAAIPVLNAERLARTPLPE